MKNSALHLAVETNSSNGHNGQTFEAYGGHIEPSLHARMRYGARLKRAARLLVDIDRSFSLTSKTRNVLRPRFD